MKKPNYPSLLVSIVLILAPSLWTQGYGQVTSRADSLINLLSKTSEDSTYIRISLEIADEFFYDLKDSSRIYINKAMDKALSCGDKESYADGLNYLGNLCVNQAHYVSALEYFQAGLKICQEIDDKIGQANLTNNIGIIYSTLEDHQKAIRNFEEAFRLNFEMSNWRNASFSLHNISGEYIEIDSIQKARDYYNQMVDLRTQHSESVTGNELLGEIYLKENKPDSALSCFLLALEEFRTIGDSYMLAATRLDLARTFILKKDYHLSERQLGLAENVCRQSEFNELLLDIIGERTKLYQAQGFYAQALTNQETYISFKDSLDNINKFNRISELNAKYEAEKRDSEISKQQQQLQSKNSVILTTFVGIGALVVISGLILFNLLKKRKMNAVLKNQNSQIRQQRQKIISSLNYAKKIQKSILVPEKVMKDFLPESFIFFKPKDIVSGDFYWFKKIGDSIILATVDCTGHGVPGAFMSLIANSQLEKAVSEKGLTDPGNIMRFVHDQILVILNQDNQTMSAQDGLDITICKINRNENKLRFAGSGNAIYLVRDNEITELKTESYGLAGGFFAKKSGHSDAFSSKEICYEIGTDLFMLTDGYLDQFGGAEKKKLNKSRFRELLKTLNQSNLKNAQQVCEQFFDNWKGNLPQLDDVLVIGARL